MLYDFSTILPLFGLQAVTVELPTTQPIDADTGYSVAAPAAETKTIRAVVFPAESWDANTIGTQLLPTGAFKAGDFLVFVGVPTRATDGTEVTIELYGEGKRGTNFVIHNKRYGATKVWDFADSGRFRVYLAAARPEDTPG